VLEVEVEVVQPEPHRLFALGAAVAAEAVMVEYCFVRHFSMGLFQYQ